MERKGAVGAEQAVNEREQEEFASKKVTLEDSVRRGRGKNGFINHI